MFTRQWRYLKEMKRKKEKKKKELNIYQAFELMHKNDGTFKGKKDGNV